MSDGEASVSKRLKSPQVRYLCSLPRNRPEAVPAWAHNPTTGVRLPLPQRACYPAVASLSRSRWLNPRSKSASTHGPLSETWKKKIRKGSSLRGLTMYSFKELPCEDCDRLLPVFDPATMEEKHYNWRTGIAEEDLRVSLTEDPFAAEIHHDFALHWLCQECVYRSSMEI